MADSTHGRFRFATGVSLLFAVLLVVALAPGEALSQPQVIDDMEGDPASDWSTNGPVVIGLANDPDVPDEDGGSQSLAVEVDESEGSWGQFEGAQNTADFSDAADPYLNFYLKVDGPQALTDDPAGLAIQAFDFDGEQFNSPNNVEIAPSDWQLISIALSDFVDADEESGDGNFPNIGQLVLQFQGVTSGSEFTAKFDFIAVTSDGQLPVELTAFDATLDGRDALLQWQTGSETNNAGFDLMHEAPGTSSFEAVTFVEGAGTTTQPQSYSYRLTDLVPGTHRFRLRQEDLDGSTTLTDPVRVTVGAVQTDLALEGANPFRSTTQVRYGVESASPVQLSLYDVLGRKVRTVFEGRLSAESVQQTTIDGSNLPAGVYFLRLQTPTATKTQRLTLLK